MSLSSTTTAQSCEAITPSDTVNFTGGTARAVYIGVGGDAVIVTDNGTAVTFKGAAAGSVIPVRCVRVNSTSTTATDLVALF